VFIQAYRQEELTFAYCYRVYMRWRTHRGKQYSELTQLTESELAELIKKYEIHLLEVESNSTDVLTTISLKPADTISAAASKVKGQVSSWLRTKMKLADPTKLLSVGYFACTVGQQSTTDEVEKYLESQSEHHGYANRILPPVYVERFEPELEFVEPKHASVVSQFHIVLATAKRLGVFGSECARRVAKAWREFQAHWQVALLKVSFVPDHVHIAIRAHPSVAPSMLITNLMNTAQPLMERELVTAKLDRLWQPSAYLGSYGDLASAQIKQYLVNWKKRES